jgi:type IV pilus assembly protein PilA
MVELMIVVLVIGVLIAIALPTYLATRARAQDRRAQQDVRIAFTAERAYYTDTLTYTTNAAEMTAIESALNYQAGDTPGAPGEVYLHLVAGPNQVFISTKSVSGTCFYLTEVDGASIGFAASSGCGVVDAQTYGNGW